MLNKVFSWLLLTMVAFSMYILAFNVQPVKTMREKITSSTSFAFLGASSNERSFGLSTRISETSGGYPVVATDGIGGVYVSWWSKRQLNGFVWEELGIFFTCSHDYGETWSEDIRVNNEVGGSVSYSTPSVAFDQLNEYVYVAWCDNRTGETNLYVSRSTDRGISFEPDVKANDYEGSAIASLYSVNIAVADDGRLCLAWTDSRSNPSGSDIYFASSTDKGQTFSSNLKVHPDEDDASHRLPWITIDSDGVIYVVYDTRSTSKWNIYMVRSLDDGISFEAPAKINDDFSENYRGKKEVAVSKDGKIHVVWTDGRAWGGEGIGWVYWDIYFSTSFDSGVSFSPNVRVNDDVVPPVIPPDALNTGQGTPSLAIDSDGGIHVVWEDTRNYDSASSYFRDTYYAFSEDYSTFSENVIVNYVLDATRIDCADPNIAIDSSDNLFIVWADAPYGPSLSDYHIYFAFSPAAGVVLSAWASTAPTIDGVINTEEWSSASSATFTLNSTEEALEATLYAMNDVDNLYMAFSVNDSDFGDTYETQDYLVIQFDDDHNGVIEDGEEMLIVNAFTYPDLNSHLADQHFNISSGQTYDHLYGGTNDGSAEVGRVGISNHFEFSHPLCSVDTTHDFCLDLGDTVGFNVYYRDKKAFTGSWPSFPAIGPGNDVTDWGDIIIAYPNAGMLGDVDGDGDVDSQDLFTLAPAYGTSLGDALYDERCDFDNDGDVDSMDLFTLAPNYGKPY